MGHTGAPAWLGEASGPCVKPGDCGSGSLSAPPRHAGLKPEIFPMLMWAAVPSTRACGHHRTGVRGEYVKSGNSAGRCRPGQAQPRTQTQGLPVLADTAAGASVCAPGEDTEVPGQRDEPRVPRLHWLSLRSMLLMAGHTVPSSCLLWAGGLADELARVPSSGTHQGMAQRKGAELCAICLPGDL